MRNIWHDIDPHAITPTHFTAVIEIPAGSLTMKTNIRTNTRSPTKIAVICPLNVYFSSLFAFFI